MREDFDLVLAGHGDPPVRAPSGDAAIYLHPEEVAGDPELTLADKRAILASWISDARAVENAPTLRRLDSGAVVEADAILRALGSLDGSSSDPATRRHPAPFPGRRVRAASKWMRRIGLPPRFNDDDDDPPQAPAGVGAPFRPPKRPVGPGAALKIELESGAPALGRLASCCV